MAKEIKEEYKVFMKDVEKNIKNKEDLNYLKKRIPEFMDKVIHELDNIEIKMGKKENEIQEILDTQKTMEKRFQRMERIVDNLEKDIYAEDGFDFEIVCPYCNSSVIIDVDENKTEVKCPECDNLIELDWSGDPEADWMYEEDWKLENPGAGCNGSCSQCPGCDIDIDDDM